MGRPPHAFGAKVHVMLTTFSSVIKDGVRLRDGLEAYGGDLHAVAVLVGVPLLAQVAVRELDVFRRRGGEDAKHLVVVHDG